MAWYTALSLPRSVQSAQSAHDPAAAAALASLWSLPVEVQTDGKLLRWRPADAVGPDLKLAIQANKAAIIAALTGSPDWDAGRAARVLAECENTINAALISANLTPIQRSVSDALRDVVRTHAATHDLLLFQDQAFLAEQFAGWQRFNAASAPPRRKTA